MPAGIRRISSLILNFFTTSYANTSYLRPIFQVMCSILKLYGNWCKKTLDFKSLKAVNGI
jgi:hypothetical protein